MALPDLLKAADEAERSQSPQERGRAPIPPQKPVPVGELTRQGLPKRPVEQRVLTLSVDPARVRVWALHDRSASWFNEEDCKDLITSIRRDGQRIAALARKLDGDPDFDYELIYGARRRFACQVLKTQLRIELTEADDATCVARMLSENTDRTDVTPFERALSFKRFLERKTFRTAAEMAQQLSISEGNLSRSLKAASILDHQPIAKLLPDPKEVPVELAYKLALALDADGALGVVTAAARNLARPERKPANAKAALNKLLGSLASTKTLPAANSRYVVGTTEVMLSRTPKGKLSISFPKGLQKSGVTPEFMDELKKAVIAFIDPVS